MLVSVFGVLALTVLRKLDKVNIFTIFGLALVVILLTFWVQPISGKGYVFERISKVENGIEVDLIIHLCYYEHIFLLGFSSLSSVISDI